jgi:ubiquinone/menaquinone biosynthesis C-methylase UbiE
LGADSRSYERGALRTFVAKPPVLSQGSNLSRMSVRQGLYNFYWWSRRRIAPTLVYSQEIYEQVLDQYITPEAAWLDLGCGHQILPSWRLSHEKELVQQVRTIVGLDYDMPSLVLNKTLANRVRGDVSLLPFRSNTFDLVTANMVVEHLSEPEIQFREVARVLKPGGLFIFHTPNALGYFAVLRRLVPGFINKRLAAILDGREEGDVFPIHYKANDRQTISALATDARFEVVEQRMVTSDAVFSLVPPLMLIELVWIRALLADRFAGLRTNIIAILRKRPTIS